MHDPNASVRLHVKKGKMAEKSRVLLRVQTAEQIRCDSGVEQMLHAHKLAVFLFESIIQCIHDQAMDRQFTDHYTETDWKVKWSRVCACECGGTIEHNQNFSEHVNGATNFVTYFTINYNFVLVQHDGYGPEHTLTGVA